MASKSCGSCGIHAVANPLQILIQNLTMELWVQPTEPRVIAVQGDPQRDPEPARIVAFQDVLPEIPVADLVGGDPAPEIPSTDAALFLSVDGDDAGREGKAAHGLFRSRHDPQERLGIEAAFGPVEIDHVHGRLQE